MRYLKSSKDKDAMQLLAHKFPVGETHGEFVVKKDGGGKIYFARIKTKSAMGIPQSNASVAIPKDCYGGLWNQNHTASIRSALQKISHKFQKGISNIAIKVIKDEFANIYVQNFDIQQESLEWVYPVTFEIGEFKFKTSIQALTDEAIIPIPGIGKCVFSFYAGEMAYKFKRVILGSYYEKR